VSVCVHVSACVCVSVCVHVSACVCVSVCVEVDSYRVELEDIKVRGKHCPKPIKTWAQCGVSKKELECLKKYVASRRSLLTYFLS